MSPTEILSAAIKSVTHRWIADGVATNAKGICEQLATGFHEGFYQEVLAQLGPDKVEEMGISILSMPDFFKPNAEWQLSLCRMTTGEACIDPHLPNGLCWNDIYEVSDGAGWLESKFTWIAMDKSHFDAEAPDGVDHIFQLPLLSRDIHDY
ncbi:hypothetical protein RYA05_02100 [Pseudomonas syringae pv. actinidiae]|nr:hypothetical protein [Pseudomonas syringae pv. actinidiae]